MNLMKVAQVYIEHPVMAIDQTYSYTYPEGMRLSRGVRVKVSFNRREVIGFVDRLTEIDENSLSYQLLPILEVLDESPLLNDEMYALAEWMAYRTISPRIACFQAMLPSKIRPKSNRKPVKMLQYVAYQSEPEEFNGRQRQQKEALYYLKEHGEMLRSEWRDLFGISSTRNLEEKNYVFVFEKEAQYLKEEKNTVPFFTLTPAQKRAFDELNASEKEVILLHGATGSGKTEIYLQMADQIIKEGRQALILVPEIGLTPQMVKRVEERFGDNVAIYHSKLNDQERYEQFMRVKNHEVSVVVGTRSAVFMPLDNIGLIVMDEEHDQSYKQMNKPFYHCRDIAIKRGEYHHCKVILGSATPSLESYARAKKGVYGLVTLLERVNHQPLPRVVVVDVNQQLRRKDSYIITKPLRDAIEDRLRKNEQIIILLNRRGYNPIMRCSDCNTVVTCPDCDLAMNYHKDLNKLVCHTCGRIMDVPDTCEKCGSHYFVRSGYGTQKLEEELQRLFPSARIMRMDTDTVGKKKAHEEYFTRFGNHEADILLGTQMIAKGLDYPLVTLVGILNSDALLARSDFRSVETTFDLIVQASGRSGRGKDAGEVYVQAFDPGHYAIRYASKHDYLHFFAEEMNYRHVAKYPPYTYLISMVFSHSDLERYETAILDLSYQLKSDEKLKVLGPSDLLRTFNKQRKRIIIKGMDLDHMIEAVRSVYDTFMRTAPEVGVVVDVNPLSLE